MQHTEAYRGVEVLITVNPAGDGQWTASAGFKLPAEAPARVTSPEASYSSEEAARAAALQAAVEAIDRARVATGKR
jgi:hypothetical protein